MDNLLIKDARLLDPTKGIDQVADVLVREGQIEQIGQVKDASGLRVIDGQGLLLTPGLVDLHVHLREPGDVQKETIASGLQAAAAGGFTDVCAMPNTRPANDSPEVTCAILERAREVKGARLHPVGAITRERKGAELTEMGALAEAGCVALSDDGDGIQDGEVMRRALEYSKLSGLPLALHEEDASLSRKGTVHEGEVSLRRGLTGIPAAAEDVMVTRDIELARLTGGRIHICHVSTATSVALIRQAKADGLAVTAEVTPHHLVFTDEALLDFSTAMKVKPPLRSEQDRTALLKALREGVIDCVASDHAPHELEAKETPFPDASDGMIGLQTTLPVLLQLVEAGSLSLERAIDSLTTAARSCFGLEARSLEEGQVADLTLIDLERAMTFDERENLSRSANSGFWGMEFKGRAVMTIVAGQVVYECLEKGVG